MALRVLALASEAFPLVKTGGLADVVGALPGALAPVGIAVTTMLPGYPAVMQAMGAAPQVLALAELFGGPARVLRGTVAGMDVLALDAPHLFARPGNPYVAPGGREWEDNGTRFAALAAAGALVARGALGAAFDVVHAHDWQAALVAAYLRFGPLPRVPVVFTIHNLAFQGHFPAWLFPLLGLPAEAFALGGLEYHGGVGLLKAGIWFADRITTVSPTYATEIRTHEGGMGLDGLLRGRGGDVRGILNGIDDAEWNPATDARLPARFSAADMAPRLENKRALQRRFGLEERDDVPLFGFVGRLAWQKGVDLILEALPWLLGSGAQLAIVGTGEAALEERCRGAAAANAGRIGTVIGFDEGLARLLYAGADAVLVPSRFEPCGLAQLCALRYGAAPVVARVGGLADTVIDANEMAVAAGCATGVQFSPVGVEMLGAAIDRTVALYRQPAVWARVQANAMAADVSWARSAARYAALFHEVAGADA